MQLAHDLRPMKCLSLLMMFPECGRKWQTCVDRVCVDVLPQWIVSMMVVFCASGSHDQGLVLVYGVCLATRYQYITLAAR